MSGDQVDLSIVVPTYGRTSLCKRSLLSLEEALKRVEHLKSEIIIGVDGPDPETSALLRNLEPKFSNFKLKTMEFTDMRNPPAIRNRLIKKSNGHWIYFADDDAFVAPDFFEKFYQIQSSLPKAAVIGGPNLTPPGSNTFQKASGLTLSSRFATFFSSARYNNKGAQRVCDEQSLILCNLFVRRSALDENPFLEDLVCAEENRLLQDMKRDGEVLIYDPVLSVWHERRPNFSTFARQVFKYGFGRGQIIRKYPSELKLAHALPALCLGYTLCLAALFLMQISFPLIWLSPFLVYATLCPAASLLTDNKNETLATKALSSLLFPVIHVFYGCGWVWGMVRG